MEEQGPPSRSRACTVAPTGLEEAARSGSAPDDHFITRPDRRMKGPCRRCTSCCGWRYSGQSQGRVSDFTAEEVVRSPAASHSPSSGKGTPQQGGEEQPALGDRRDARPLWSRWLGASGRGHRLP